MAQNTTDPLAGGREAGCPLAKNPTSSWSFGHRLASPIPHFKISSDAAGRCNALYRGPKVLP